MTGLLFCLGCLFGYFASNAERECRPRARNIHTVIALAFFIAALIINP